MKGMIVTLSIFLAFSLIGVQATSTAIKVDPTQAFLDPTPPADRYVLDGQIHWGPYVNCELFNETQNDLRILRYVYDFWIRNQWGQIERRQQLYQCVSGCLVESFSMVRLIGPQNSPIIRSASCRALVRRVDLYDGHDDDFNLRSPKVFDRW